MYKQNIATIYIKRKEILKSILDNNARAHTQIGKYTPEHVSTCLFCIHTTYVT